MFHLSKVNINKIKSAARNLYNVERVYVCPRGTPDAPSHNLTRHAISRACLCYKYHLAKVLKQKIISRNRTQGQGQFIH